MADLNILQSTVFSRIKNNFPKTIKVNGKTILIKDENFSTVGSSDTPAVFPFVYIKLLPGVEQGQDTEGDTINAGLFTFQIDVTDNQSQSRATKVMNEVVKIMKSMRFSVIAMPSFDDTKDTHRITARFRRVIGANDIL